MAKFGQDLKLCLLILTLLVQLLEVVLLVAMVGLDEVDGAAELGVDPAHLRFDSSSGSFSKNLKSTPVQKVHFRDEKTSNVAKFRIPAVFFLGLATAN